MVRCPQMLGMMFNNRTLSSAAASCFDSDEVDTLLWERHPVVGWVETAPSFVGFRCTQPNLHFAGVIAKCETQQRPISEPCRKSFYFD